MGYEDCRQTKDTHLLIDIVSGDCCVYYKVYWKGHMLIFSPHSDCKDIVYDVVENRNKILSDDDAIMCVIVESNIFYWI